MQQLSNHHSLWIILRIAKVEDERITLPEFINRI